MRVLVNGSAGVVVTQDAAPTIVMSFTVAEGRIVQIAGIADPGRVRRAAEAVLQGDIAS
jgi:hypothetical protein